MSCTPGLAVSVCAQSGCTGLPPVVIAEPPRVGPIPPAGFSTEPLDFVAGYWADTDGDERGFWHVTVDGPSVLESGLKSRRELGFSRIGLGGGYNNQAPDRVSITYSADHAYRIADRMRLAARAARREVGVEEIINSYENEITSYLDVDEWWELIIGGSIYDQDFYDDTLDEDELWGYLIEHAEKEYGDCPYELVVKLEDNLGHYFSEPDVFIRVGFTASAEQMGQIDPERIQVLDIAVARDASVEINPEERELRVAPEHLWVLTDRENEAGL